MTVLTCSSGQSLLLDHGRLLDLLLLPARRLHLGQRGELGVHVLDLRETESDRAREFQTSLDRFRQFQTVPDRSRPFQTGQDSFRRIQTVPDKFRQVQTVG